MRIALVCCFLLLVSGCQSQTIKPEASAEGAMPPPASDASRELQRYFSRMVESNQQVEQRITLMQEQVIKANQQLEVQQQRNLQMLQALQQIQLSMQQQPQSSNGEGPNQTSLQGADSMDVQQTLLRIEQSLATGSLAAANGTAQPGGFRLVSAYTPKGQWVIFKYDEISGLTWMAREGGWSEIVEPRRLPMSRYEVVLRPAAGDIKGYVAARVDRQTGESWWLKGDRWEAFQ